MRTASSEGAGSAIVLDAGLVDGGDAEQDGQGIRRTRASHQGDGHDGHVGPGVRPLAGPEHGRAAVGELARRPRAGSGSRSWPGPCPSGPGSRRNGSRGWPRGRRHSGSRRTPGAPTTREGTGSDRRRGWTVVPRRWPPAGRGGRPSGPRWAGRRGSADPRNAAPPRRPRAHARDRRSRREGRGSTLARASGPRGPSPGPRRAG